MVLMALMIPGGRSWAPFKGVHLNRLIKTYSEKMPGQLAEMYLDIKAAKKDQVHNFQLVLILLTIVSMFKCIPPSLNVYK